MDALLLLNELKVNMVTPTKERGLVFVRAYLIGKSTKTLINIGATHNFLYVGVAEQLGIPFKWGNGYIMVVDVEHKPFSRFLIMGSYGWGKPRQCICRLWKEGT